MTALDEPAARMPGDILLHDWLEPNRISMYRLAKAMRVPQVFVSDLVHGNKRITTQAAFKLAKTLGNTPEYWLDLQTRWDVANYDADNVSELERITSMLTDGIEQNS
ncbi:helix-turn-helix motif protein [Bifidobacterium saguini DSM 23967]|uniref:Helix-turn-helix motif protein n=1 Tax=Bifidobacterium saguini DSM 23967 TaxID=1437607 RepID=A0A087D6W0_9BIFI|nr:HigA family addiction module antitoxin [Bifidobacterium saguini]KFI91260.1 helix-turn-helix motif protein [Bifidobacterium saguini DSM 23967]